MGGGGGSRIDIYFIVGGQSRLTDRETPRVFKGGKRISIPESYVDAGLGNPCFLADHKERGLACGKGPLLADTRITIGGIFTKIRDY